MNRPSLHFEDLTIWQRAMDIFEEIHFLTADSKDYALRDQIRRSTLSISANIAEGWDRGYSQELIRYLNIAKGSCAETRSHLHAASRIKMIPKEDSSRLIEEAKRLSGSIYALRKQIETKL